MNIAIYHNLPSGGGKRALYEMIRRLVDRHAVDVFTLSTADHDFCDLRPLVRQHQVFPFTPWGLLGSPFGRLNQGIYLGNVLRVRPVQQRMATQIDAGNYDVVFAHHCRFAQAPAILQYLKTPAVYYCQEPPRHFYEPPHDRPYLRSTGWRKRVNDLDPLIALHRTVAMALDRRATLAARTVLVNSAFSRESIYRTYGRSAQVNYLGADLSNFKALNLPRERFVLSVGALAPHKGYDFLLRALAQIESEQRPLLVIVCNQLNPPEHAFLFVLAQQLGVRVDFRHKVDEAELVRLYNTALFTVYAPVMEPFGFVPIESMACGTPVVGVREGGVRETIEHEHTGLLVDRDPTQFAQAMKRLLQDANIRDRYGRQGRESVAQRWRWDASVAQLERMLEASCKWKIESQP